jgi:hypothetical protein
VKRTTEAIERDAGRLIKRGHNLRRDSLELRRATKELLSKAARLKGILAKQKAAVKGRA